MAGQWAMFVDDRPWSGQRSLYIQVRDRRGEPPANVAPLVLVRPIAGQEAGPTMQESREDREDAVGDVTGFLQCALDAAWALGMRPKGFADHTNELKAVRDHLADMRTLALPKP